jgi:ribosomal-protein-serine acetyltransferase
MTAPILRDIPEQLESDRLLIRCPRPGDGPAIHEAIAESLDELLPWMPWAHGEQTVETAETYAREANAAFLARKHLPLNLYLRDEGTFVGGSGLHDVDWAIPRFEIGYWVRSSLTGRGYATEATRRIAQFAFDDLGAERVEIWCDARNQRSAAVAQRAGFAFEARLQRSRIGADGVLADSLCFVRLRDRAGATESAKSTP